MIEKIQLSEVESSLPGGKPASVRALDSSGNSIQSSIPEVAESIGTYSVNRSFAPLEEYEVKEVYGCLALIQNTSSQHNIGVAIMYSDLGGLVLNDVSGVDFFKQGNRTFSIYRKEANSSLYIKNNTEFFRTIHAKFISII